MMTEMIMPDFRNRLLPVHFTTAMNILAKMGISGDHIDLLAVGRYENYRGEVQEQEPEPGTHLSENSQITLKIGISSPVDYMPYQFFQSPGDWEARARTLMAPFDSSVIRYASDAKLLALKYNLGVVDTEHLYRVLKLFHFSMDEGEAGPGEALLWTTLFPTFHLWAGNAERVVAILGYFFPWNFRINENVCSEYEIPEELQYRLGSKGGLGREVLVGRTFCEYDSAYELVVSGVRPDEVPGLFPGGSARNKLEWMMRTCMSGNLDCRIRVEVEGRRMALGADGGKSYLGYVAQL
ncbi:MAG TPA: type VI secretion system baseplate subunit TssG [Candidatus Acidoferrum sp.]|nr:type VI secretion system baseplate subunit TssG [Candidatus Acidoferrum sp.]